MMQGNGEDIVWLEWLDKVMKSRPSGNILLDSQRGIEGGRLCHELEKKDFNWHRSDEDTFWIDIQLFVKYGLSDQDIITVCRMQPGVENYKKHSEERNAYAEMMRGIKKLRGIMAKNAIKAEDAK